MTHLTVLNVSSPLSPTGHAILVSTILRSSALKTLLFGN